jgi:hypothetical protein
MFVLMEVVRATVSQVRHSGIWRQPMMDSWVPRDWAGHGLRPFDDVLTAAARTGRRAPHPLGPAPQARDADVAVTWLAAQILRFPARRTAHRTGHRSSFPYASSRA